MLKLALIFGLSVCVLPTAGYAKYPKTTEGGWLISQDDSQCNAINVFEDNTVLSFWMNWRDDTTVIYFTNDDWTSLKKRDGEKVRFDFELLGDVEYDKWYSDKAEILGKETLFGFKLWWDEKDRLDLIANWAVATAFRATADERKLGQFTLKGSRAAMLEMAACTALGLKHDRSDPFDN